MNVPAGVPGQPANALHPHIHQERKHARRSRRRYPERRSRVPARGACRAGGLDQGVAGLDGHRRHHRHQRRRHAGGEERRRRPSPGRQLHQVARRPTGRRPARGGSRCPSSWSETMVEPVTLYSASIALGGPPGGQAASPLSSWSAPGALPQIDPQQARQFATEMLGPPQRSFDEMRTSLLAQVDHADPIKTMYAMTDVTLEAHGLSLKYSLATGLTSAVVSLFGTMLKNSSQ